MRGIIAYRVSRSDPTSLNPRQVRKKLVVMG